MEHLTTLDGWTWSTSARRATMRESSRERARTTAATHGAWTVVAEPDTASAPLRGR